MKNLTNYISEKLVINKGQRFDDSPCEYIKHNFDYYVDIVDDIIDLIEYEQKLGYIKVLKGEINDYIKTNDIHKIFLDDVYNNMCEIFQCSKSKLFNEIDSFRNDTKMKKELSKDEIGSYVYVLKRSYDVCNLDDYENSKLSKLFNKVFNSETEMFYNEYLPEDSYSGYVSLECVKYEYKDHKILLLNEGGDDIYFSNNLLILIR